MKLTNLIDEEYADISGDIIENISKNSQTITTLLTVFEYWLKRIGGINGHDLRIVSECMQKKDIEKNFVYTKKDITEFSIAMAIYENHSNFENAGVFLSSLMYQHWKKNSVNGWNERIERNKKAGIDESLIYELAMDNVSDHALSINKLVNDRKNKTANIFKQFEIDQTNESDGCYKIITQHLQTQIGHIGYRNSGIHIYIVGNAGKNLGAEMNNGSIFLEGNANFMAGSFMEGGTISINDSQKGACFGMKGGRFYIRGDVLGNIGIQMNGGIIHIDGKIASDLDIKKTYAKIRSSITKGKLYHQGKLIVYNFPDTDI